MVRYFKKELPDNPLILPGGKRVAFKASRVGVGLLATKDNGLLSQLEIALKRNLGGLIEVGEFEYLTLRDGKPKPAPVRRNGHAAEEPSIPGIDRLYINWKLAKGQTVFKPIPTGIRTVGRFIHVLERHRQPDLDSERRVTNAFWSWSWHYERGSMVPCHVWDYPRSARTIGDARDLPYLKDVLAEGLKLASSPDDVLVLTNDDTVIHQKIIWPMTVLLRSRDAVSSFRMNFEQKDMPATNTKVSKIRQWGEACLGRDLFAFRAEWLRLNWNAIPDMILGEQEWDLVLAVMVRMAAGKEATKLNLSVQEPSCELDRGYIIHETHARNWKNDRFAKAPAKVHNNHLTCAFMADNGFEELIGGLV